MMKENQKLLLLCGDSYQDIFAQMHRIFTDIDEKYADKKKGIFLSNDTYANMFLNLIFQKYGYCQVQGN